MEKTSVINIGPREVRKRRLMGIVALTVGVGLAFLLDERLLLMLEAGLREQGCEVFIDRHLTIGVEWAREIERRVQQAVLVIVLEHGLGRAFLGAHPGVQQGQTAHARVQRRVRDDAQAGGIQRANRANR